MLSDTDLTTLRAVAVDIAESAAELIRSTRADLSSRGDLRSFSMTKSSSVDPVTVVDTLAESFIAEELHRRRPEDGLIGEEGHERASTSGVSWIVDPIDGTVNFLYGIEEYAVSLGAAVDGEVVAGAVINVAKNELFHAARGLGARRRNELEERDLHCNDVDDVGQALVATGFSYNHERRRAQAELLVEVLPGVRDIRRMGAAALDLCRVADGTVDAYYEHGINCWDFAGGLIVAQEAGAIARTPRLSTPGSAGEITFVAAAGVAGQLENLLREARGFHPIDQRR